MLLKRFQWAIVGFLALFGAIVPLFLDPALAVEEFNISNYAENVIFYFDATERVFRVNFDVIQDFQIGFRRWDDGEIKLASYDSVDQTGLVMGWNNVVYDNNDVVGHNGQIMPAPLTYASTLFGLSGGVYPGTIYYENFYQGNNYDMALLYFGGVFQEPEDYKDAYLDNVYLEANPEVLPLPSKTIGEVEYFSYIQGAEPIIWPDKSFLEILGPLSQEVYIEGFSPASTTEITDLDQNITIKYYNFDWEIYNGFIVSFIDDKLGVVAESQQFLADDLSPTGSGQVVVNLQDFNIDTNGKWYLTALGFGTELDIQGGMFLTTRGYVDFWTDELVDPEYYLLINIEGFASPYTFTDPEDWYGVNVDRFDTPTDFFYDFVGLLTPIFEKISDFNLRSQSFFDKLESYDRGYALGEIFPLATGYVKKIESFFGGFPLIQFFIYAILTIIAIFIIRMTIKFIPFIGGS